MRFLLFNIAVGAAVIYLLVGDPAATARQTGLPVAKAAPKPNLVAKPVVEAVAETLAPKAVPSINQAKFIPTKPVHSAPTPKRYPAAKAKKGDRAPLPPQVSQRRAEVLGNGKTDGKFAVKDGAAMMSPGDRYRELSKLVDDMELVYFHSLGN
jgi:hypothetical protein